MTSTKIPKVDNKLFKLLEKYFQLLQRNELKELASKYYHYSTKDEEILKLVSANKVNIKTLDKLFKDIIIERNKFAERRGYINYIEYVIQRDGVPTNKASEMLDKADKILESVADLNLIPEDIKPVTKLRTTDPFYFIQSRTFNLVEDGVDLVKRYDPKFIKLLPSIKFQNRSEYSTEFINSTVIIKAKLNSKNLSAFANFVHELGHAKQVLTTNKEEYIKLSRFEREVFAYKYQLDMLSKYLESQEMDYIKWKMLSKVADAWFEYKIHLDAKYVEETYNNSRFYLYSSKFHDIKLEYLLNFSYQKYACESIMRGVIAHELITV